jgi:hypothetical protein
VNPLNDPKRNRFLDQFDARFRSDVANCFFRVLRTSPGLDDSEVCRAVWLDLRDRSARISDDLPETGSGSGTTPFVTFAGIASAKPALAIDFATWARAWDSLSPVEKKAVRGKA